MKLAVGNPILSVKRAIFFEFSTMIYNRDKAIISQNFIMVT